MDSINPQTTQHPEILAALEQIKQWQKNGKTDDAMQGCKEILEIDPENTEAKTILSSMEKPMEQPTPATLTSKAEKTDYEITTPENPLYNVLTKSTPVKTKTEGKKKSHGILLNLGIVIVTLAFLGGVAYAYLTFFGDKTDIPVVELPEENVIIPTEDDNLIEEDTNTEDAEIITFTESDIRNEQRLDDLTEIETVIKDYYTQNGKYPDATTLATLMEVTPYDPMDGESDENGQIFAYSYSVYDTDAGDNQEYILAGLIEDQNGENTVWTTGADPQDHSDFRDGTAENFIMITAQTTDTEEDSGPKVKVKR